MKYPRKIRLILICTVECYTDEELLDKINKYHIPADEISLANHKLLHAYVGAYEAEILYGIDDEEIKDAIYPMTKETNFFIGINIV